MEVQDFSRAVHDKIGYYIYLYSDPRNDEIFYVGKGRGNRAFSHLKEQKESDKRQRICDILADGHEPIIEILVHGIDDDYTARKIEASIIDLVGLGNLTNVQGGYETREFGRMSVAQIKALYGAEPVDVDEPALLININNSFRYGMSAVQLYDATRSAWRIGLRRETVTYAMAVYQGIVQEVYHIALWLPNNATLNSLKRPEDDADNPDRWEFVGQIAEDDVRQRYLYHNVGHLMGPRNPLNYVNC